MQMKIISGKIKTNIKNLSNAVRDENFANEISSDRFEQLENLFISNQQVQEMYSLVNLQKKISMVKIRNVDKVMGLVPGDYHIYKSLKMIDNEGNQRVDFDHHDHHHEEEEEDDDHDHLHEELDEKIHKWYEIIMNNLIVDHKSLGYRLE
jgi:hypothetical protein